MLIHIQIYGRVQGVGFRAWTRKRADEYRLSGWVRNRINGSVEIMAEGEQANIDEFLKLCQKGPLFASVKRIEPVSVPTAPVLPITPGIFQNQPTV